MCRQASPHVSKAEIEADRENLKDSVFRIKHGAEWLTDAGDSMISLEHVRALIESPPEHLPGRPVAFCDFAGPGDESVLALCDGNRAEIPGGGQVVYRPPGRQSGVGGVVSPCCVLGISFHDTDATAE